MHLAVETESCEYLEIIVDEFVREASFKYDTWTDPYEMNEFRNSIKDDAETHYRCDEMNYINRNILVKGTF